MRHHAHNCASVVNGLHACDCRPPDATTTTDREMAEKLAGKWGVYTESLDGEHLVLALEEAYRLGRASRPSSEPLRELARVQPCGCVVCTCRNEDEPDRCLGCGAKHCGTHPVGQIPDPVFVSPPPSSEPGERARALEEAARICETVGRTASPDERDEYANGWSDAMTTALERIRALASAPASSPGAGEEGLRARVEPLVAKWLTEASMATDDRYANGLDECAEDLRTALQGGT